MGYVGGEAVKEYLGVTTTDDNTLIDHLIDRAGNIIEAYTGRVFKAETATKYFNTDNIEGRCLYLWGYDLLTITKLTNGNSVEITSDQYRLEPRNETPKYIVRLNEDYTWEFDDSDDEISIAGTWGYSTNLPLSIEHACIRLVAFLYRQKDTSSDVDRPLITGDGVTIMPTNLPSDVRLMLDGYKRRIA